MTNLAQEETRGGALTGRFLDSGRRYLVGRKLGSGGVGTVYELRDLKRQRSYAAKFLHPEKLGDREARRRFRREGRKLCHLRHEGLVRIYGMSRTREGLEFIVSELVHGDDLVRVLQRGGTRDAREALRIGREIAVAVHYLHRANFIHRDLKPENVMLRQDDGAVKVLDFGVAKCFDSKSFLTRKGDVLGTPGYIAPEYLQGDRLDQRADVFSLGAVLYELLTGRRTFEARQPSDLLALNRRARPTPVHRVDEAVARPVAQLIGRMLARRPSRRPSTMLDVVHCIDDTLRALEIDEDTRSGLGGFLHRFFER